MASSRMIGRVAGACAIWLLAAEAAHGQACLGVPIPQGSFAAQADVGFGDASTMYGGSVTANLAGPLSVGAGYAFAPSDSAGDAHHVSARLAFEVPGLPVSPCALVGIRHTRLSGRDGLESGLSSFTLPVGVAIVHPFPLSLDVTVTPLITAQFLTRLSEAAAGQLESDVATGYELRKGIIVGVRRIFAGFDAKLATSLEGSVPDYRLSLGLRF